jgi:hypothetical protein
MDAEAGIGKEVLYDNTRRFCVEHYSSKSARADKCRQKVQTHRSALPLCDNDDEVSILSPLLSSLSSTSSSFVPSSCPAGLWPWPMPSGAYTIHGKYRCGSSSML